MRRVRIALEEQLLAQHELDLGDDVARVERTLRLFGRERELDVRLWASDQRNLTEVMEGGRLTMKNVLASESCMTCVPIVSANFRPPSIASLWQ